MAKKTDKPDDKADEKPDEKPDDTDKEPDAEPEQEPDADESDTFDREYVEGLRSDVGKYRTRANQYAQRLHTELVRQTGRLADPADLEFSEEHLEDSEKLSAAIDSLLEDHPHLKSRTVRGDVNQGVRGEATGDVDFMGAVRALL